MRTEVDHDLNPAGWQGYKDPLLNSSVRWLRPVYRNFGKLQRESFIDNSIREIVETTSTDKL